MSFIFERNAELYVSNSLSSWNAGNTDKIPLKAGFSFNSESVLNSYYRNSIKETASRAVEQYSEKEPLITFNFSTYLNPVQSTNVESTDRYLWQALGIYTPGAIFSQVTFTNTNVSASNEITLWVKFPNQTTYRLNNCVITAAEVSGNINELAYITWTGRARSLEDIGDTTVLFSELAYTDYIRNKLSTIELTLDSVVYNVPITNYDLTISNEVFYSYRQKIGQVSQINGQYTGKRTIDGSISAYLRFGANTSATLMEAIKGLSTDLENNLASFTIHTGDINYTHASFIMPNTIFDIPNQQFNDVVTIRLDYSALESQKGAADELTVRYYI